MLSAPPTRSSPRAGPSAAGAKLLYNRSHEICQQGRGRLNQDWMWTYLGLMASHVPKGILHRLEPIDSGRAVATYDDGSVAAVEHLLGKGRTLLFGFHPGFTLRDSGGTRVPARGWLAAPVLARLGRPPADVDHTSIETTLFEHESGIAVLLSSFGPVPEGERVVSVATDRSAR